MASDPTLKIHQKIILCSAHCDDETLQLAHEAGLDANIEKPLDLPELYDIYQSFQ